MIRNNKAAAYREIVVPFADGEAVMIVAQGHILGFLVWRERPYRWSIHLSREADLTLELVRDYQGAIARLIEHSESI